MNKRYLIKDGKVIDPANKINAVLDILISGGKIEKIGKDLNVTKRSIYNWEKEGKIPKVKRDKMSRYRLYSEEDIRRLKKITGRPW